MVRMVNNNLGEFMNIEISPKEYEKKMNWDDGMMYCQLLVIDNKNDWRLPTIEELDDMRKSKNDFSELYDYWSSIEKREDMASGMDMTFGGHYSQYKTDINYVRPVRTI